MLFFDTESIGLTGPTTLIQWAGKGDVHLCEVFASQAQWTLGVINELLITPVCAWNIEHDWFHIQRLHNVLSLHDPLEVPTRESWLKHEREALNGPCLKPVAALDLFLHCKKGPLQQLMDRDTVRVRRVPRDLAHTLADELGDRVEIDAIYFARRKSGYEWKVTDEPKRCTPCLDCPGKKTKTAAGCLVEDCLGKGYLSHTDPFPDVVLHFGARFGLKPVARFVLNRDYADIPIPTTMQPGDLKHVYNPFNHRWLGTGTLPDDDTEYNLFDWQTNHWATNEDALRYAENDVLMLRDLWEHFGRPEAGDDDSTLACQMASSRWRGYAVDRAFVYGTWAHAAGAAAKVGERNAHAKVRAKLERLRCALPAIDRAARGLTEEVPNSNAATLDRLAARGKDSPLGDYVAVLKKARSKDKEADQCRKLLEAGRFHPQIKVIGALSGRMAGGGGLNAQGISTRKKGSAIRDGFTMSDGALSVLSGGDFASFQVVLAAAVWDDDDLTAELKQGKKFHGLFGSAVYDMDYDDVLDDKEKYGRAKNAVFATMFGAQAKKMAETLDLPLERAEAGLSSLQTRFPGIGRAEEEMAARFCPLEQKIEGGEVTWKTPADYVESIYGYRRYYTLENKVMKTLYDLARNLPKRFSPNTKDYWDGYAERWVNASSIRVERRAGRRQTPGGAVRSALYGAAFGLQGRTMRTAKNHVIQSPEATIAKSLQRQLWDRFQPTGVSAWQLSLLPVHDELVVAHVPEIGREIEAAKEQIIDTFKDRVPLIAMDWTIGLESWGAMK